MQEQINASALRQFSLLADLSITDEAAQEPTAAAEPELTPSTPPAPKFNDVFARYIATEKSILSAAREQAAFEEQLFGRSFTKEPSLQGLSKITSDAISALIARAEKVFAPPLGKLEIPQLESLRATGQSDWNDYRRINRCEEMGKLPIDLDKLWAHLEAAYGGEAGLKAGYRQQAAYLIREFDLKENDSVCRASSAVIQKWRLYSAKKEYGPNKGMLEVHYNYHSDIYNLFNAISCFAAQAGLYDLAREAQPRYLQIVNNSYCYASRDKMTFPGLDVVMFKDKWEFRFAHDVAEKLMLFLGEYGNP